jgi:hypothetical protein
MSTEHETSGCHGTQRAVQTENVWDATTLCAVEDKRRRACKTYRRKIWATTKECGASSYRNKSRVH